MRTYLIRGVLALAVAFAVSAPAAAQSVVRGTVVDAEGNPIEGATITIQAVDSNRQMETTTNEDGEFLQIGLQSGQYNVIAVMDDLRQALPANVSQGTPVDLAFQLTPTSGMTPEQAKAAAEMQAMAQSAIDAMRAGRDEEAIQGFNEIILKVPTCSDCFYNLGILYSRTQPSEAEAAFNKAISLRPDFAAAYTGLANLYNSQKQFDLAQQASAKAAELSSAGGAAGNAEALFNQGVIQWNAGNFAEAKEQFAAAAEADPTMAMAHYQLGMANLNLGAIPEARAAFEMYLKVDPDGPKSAEVQAFVDQLPQ